MRELFSIVVDQIERPSNFGFSHTLCLICYPLPCHALLLVCKVCVQSTGGCNEEDRGCEVEGLHTLKSAFPLLQHYKQVACRYVG